jgi:hypothetical protein
MKSIVYKKSKDDHRIFPLGFLSSKVLCKSLIPRVTTLRVSAETHGSRGFNNHGLQIIEKKRKSALVLPGTSLSRPRHKPGRKQRVGWGVGANQRLG